jgi:Zn-dependent peptidase ImmA (M78 family)/transcriptional regulator with XRE-family HTH domain
MEADIGRRIRSFREQQGMTGTQLGAAVDLRKDQISRIESGDRQLEVTEAALIADALGVTLGDLLGRERSKSLALAARVMAPLENGQAEAAQRRVHQLLELDAILVDSMGSRRGAPSDLGGQAYESAHVLTRQTSATNRGHALAEAIRSDLGLGDAPIPDLPALIETHFGVDVLVWPTGPEVSGLCVHGDGVALLFATSSATSGHLRFTLAHELAHHLLDDPQEVVIDEDLFSKGTSPEVTANAFASALLMPAAGIRSVVDRRKVDAAMIQSLIRTFEVSYAAIVIRLEALGLIDVLERTQWESRTSTSVLTEAGDPNPSELTGQSEAKRVPPRLWRAARLGYAEGKVGISILAGLQDADVEELYGELAREGLYPPILVDDLSDI